MRAWLKAVDHYWFAKGSPTTLGAMRIIIGFLCFVNLLMIAIGFQDWFTEQGYVPNALGSQYLSPIGKQFTLFGLEKALNIDPTLPFNFPRINVLSNVTETWLTAVVYAIVTFAAFTTMIGLWTKLSTIVLAVGVVSLHHRNGLILHGGDTVIRVAVLYLALAPCGLACSVDRLRALWKGRVGPEPPQVSLWVQKLFQYNLALVYFTTFWHKFQGGSHWRDLTATYYPAHLNEFKRFWVPEFFNQPPFIYATTLFTLAAELALGTIVFYRPARKWVLLSGLMLHGFIEYSMNIPLFAFLICSWYLAFYEGEEVAGFFKRLGIRLSRFKCAVCLPAGTRLRPSSEAALHAMDPLGLVEYKTGIADLENDAMASKRVLGFWPLIWLPGGFGRLIRKGLEPSVPSGREDAAS